MDDISWNKILGVGAAGYLGYAALESKYNVGTDLGMVRKFITHVITSAKHRRQGNTLPDVFEDTVRSHGQKPFLVMGGDVWSYERVNELANRVARWLPTQAFEVGDVVGLYMGNRPEYVAFWLGVLKAGGVCALLNYNVAGRGLVHSIKISGAKILVTEDEFHANVVAVRAQLPGLKLWSMGNGSTPLERFDVMAFEGKRNVGHSVRESRKWDDKALLVYTSGTTGLPKAASLPHRRLFDMGNGFACTFGISQSDVIYCALPLYHSSGGVCGTGMAMYTGSCLVIARKFSATNFWKDCRTHKATVVQYIGELCRYLLQVVPSELDAKNDVRMAVGNGLRPDIWDDFQTRFGIGTIAEFYGSTEGNASMFNVCTDKESQGAVGKMGPLLRVRAYVCCVSMCV
jgi:acyl-CoA synthetase (AMP-forming)/AMP-acid ligase II